MRRSVVAAILVLLAGTVLGGTVFRAPIGYAATAPSSLLNVFVTNDPMHPVPVREQNLDTNGNIKVHEQGTAAVHVDNLPATQAVTVSRPATAFSFSTAHSAVGLGFAGIRGPDPAGTQYAISGLTLAATGDGAATLTLYADPFSGGCLIGAGQELVTVATPAQDTASAPLLQPFVSKSTSGNVCLDYEWTGGPLHVAVVGYTIP
jgi:hypothetical protein